MTRDELLEGLRVLQAGDDAETNHVDADDLLLKFINDPEVTTEYNAIGKWYA